MNDNAKDFIDGDFFESLTTLNWKDFKNIKENDLVYVKGESICDFFSNIGGNTTNFSILTHKSDVTIFEMDGMYFFRYSCGATHKKIEIPPTLLKWYGTNLNVENDNFFHSLPLGVENVIHSNGIKHKYMEMVDKNTNKEHLLYMNISVITNPTFRKPVFDRFFKEDWVLNRTKIDFQTYTNDILKSHFILCPEGNGMDTHRAWETLYLGSIPIVSDTHHNRAVFNELPVLLVPDMCQLDESILYHHLDQIKSSIYNMEKLTKNYYTKLIKDSL